MADARIMIVEDEAVAAIHLEQQLTRLGYRIFSTADTGPKALAGLKEDQPDLILMDIKLKGPLDGIQLATRIQQDHDIPIIFLTAYADQEILDRAKPVLPFGYLVKPFEIRELNGSIEMALHKASMERRLKARERKLSRAIVEAPFPIIIPDGQGKVELASKSVRGLETDLLPGGTGEAAEGELELTIDQRVFRLIPTLIPELDQTFLYGREVTGDRELDLQRQMAVRVFNNSLEGIIIADPQGRIQLANPAFTTITGYSLKEAQEAGFNVFHLPGLEEAEEEEMREEVGRNGQWSGRFSNTRKDGQAYLESRQVYVIKDRAGRVGNYVVVFHDQTTSGVGQSGPPAGPSRDVITGLPNRDSFKKRLLSALTLAGQNQELASLLIIDIDNFKVINDSLGHEAGDLLLREASLRLREVVRAEDSLARLGGDEFAVLLANVDGEEQAERAAGRILEIMARPFRLERGEVHLTVSIGLSLYPDDGTTPADLIKNAELAMYMAKEQGRNNYQLFTSPLEQKMSRRLSLETAIRRGLERGEFWAYFQPLVDLGTGRIVGCEAMARWHLPRGEAVRPSEFIPAAEESGLIVPLGEVILRRACGAVKSWRRGGYAGLRLAVNLSPRQLQEDGLTSMVSSVLAELDLDPRLLDLEITEGAMMKDFNRALMVMRELTAIGVRFSLDDFGTGYNSLSYLKQLPLEAIKLDRTFIRDAASRPNDAAVVIKILEMARALKIKTIAEGVETMEQLTLLKRHGCDMVQGHLISRPLPPDKFGDLLEEGLGLDSILTEE